MIPPMLQMGLLRAGYRDGSFTPSDVVEAVLERVAAYADPAVWISRVPAAALRERAARLAFDADAAALPLYGIPFAIKDNIDAAGMVTTAGCPAFARMAAEDARVVVRLLAAGAILIGKTNLDQFATGLVGTRSPYGAPRSVFDSRYISGGSSSGSAVAVAAGLVSFALGTDTAGSGRVPASFNNIVGLKPTKGRLSTTGVVPACRSVDCVSVFAATAGDAWAVAEVAEGFDPADPFSRLARAEALPLERFRFGVLAEADREFFGDFEAARLYEAAIDRLAGLGGEPMALDYGPFRRAAALLYEGPFVAERLAAIRGFFEANEAAMDPTVAGIIGKARNFSAADAFEGEYALRRLGREAVRAWAAFDLMLLPTAPTLYTVEAVMADPLRLNSRLGLYTNFVNLLDYSAIAVPAGFRPSNGLPFGVTLVGPAFADRDLAVLGDRLHRVLGSGVGKALAAADPATLLAADPPDRILVAVAGAHLSGMPLNPQLLGLGGTLLRQARTAPGYRLIALRHTTPPKPALVRAPDFTGPGIEIEIWSLDPVAFGRFVADIPAPMGIGKVLLEDGGEIPGFVCEAHAYADGEDITAWGGWRAWCARPKVEPS